MDVEQEIQVLKQVNEILLRSLIQPGTVLPFAGTQVPSDEWLVCDGSAVSRVGYATLFKVIGETYGSGDGSTTFNLPDLRGRTVIGAGQATGLTDRLIGQAIGAETHTLTLEEMPLHAHSGSTAAAGNHAHSGSTAAAGNHAHSGSTAAAGNHAHSGSTTEANLFSMIFDWNQGGNQRGYYRSPAESPDPVAESPYDRTMYPQLVDIPSSSNHAHSLTTDATGDHAHGVSIDAVGDHAHGVSIDAVGDHAHGVSIEASGEGKSHNNMPPSLVLNYIIKT